MKLIVKNESGTAKIVLEKTDVEYTFQRELEKVYTLPELNSLSGITTEFEPDQHILDLLKVCIEENVLDSNICIEQVGQLFVIAVYLNLGPVMDLTGNVIKQHFYTLSKYQQLCILKENECK